MRNFNIRFVVLLIIIVVGLLISSIAFGNPAVHAQQPTVAVATVTGTPEGPTARVNSDREQINVRSGPKTSYDLIGVLVAGQVVPAYGKSASGEWIQIAYAGVSGGVAWVYSPLVTVIRAGELPIIEPPPFPTPRITSTVNATLAAEFIEEIPATRLPTFTAPPPLIIPTFESPTEGLATGNFPMGLVIAILGFIGMFGALISLFRRR
ncbi:MAG: SH3 domain-containing protein [Chloroflexi bacterium]|jgi:hypothetical protein|nr:SH3 domain-containing protein [Chloroflexota bacterium]MBT3669926.1 SH3 domain-containing protein [Chloroflexota bacterium]MBT4003999.1 SH3 domain-containing protein [Chloroflexota bacterium]MBT4304828.1 SH3 domain-containing protein [Chloroflexota bacterium]MBT4534671.1 SH3 domain-containing protein [Chloroflexota bacterium]